ncbi:hypothetical protein HPP92_023284 [Vanilla planifolia]|uniref:Uncharacterized protein n=1 Tax=Vanilla planifolia TaxID=51239 RepID=A0A835PY70_VANPL|nr:hypothetical protein HPP92_023284 [Vanilla planifolia]
MSGFFVVFANFSCKLSASGNGAAQALVLHHVALVLFLLFILNKLGICQAFVYFIALIYLYKLSSASPLLARLLGLAFLPRLSHVTTSTLVIEHEIIIRSLQDQGLPIAKADFESSLDNGSSCTSHRTMFYFSEYLYSSCFQCFWNKLHLDSSSCNGSLIGLRHGQWNPPMFTEIQVLRKSHDDYHLVCCFILKDDMNAVLAVKLRRRLGFGMWSKVHVTRIHIEGKVLVGVKFIQLAVSRTSMHLLY